MAESMKEFITIERHVELAEWKAARWLEPEKRVLRGETLLVRYCEEDQPSAVAEAIRRGAEKYKKKVELERVGQLTADEKKLFRWSYDKLSVKLRLADTGLKCTLDDMVLRSTLQEGDKVVVYSRWAVDDRLPISEQKPFTPTVRQLLYGPRASLDKIVLDRAEDGTVVAGYVELTMEPTRRSDRVYCFNSIEKPIEPGLYTLDIDPNNIYSYLCLQVVERLCSAEEHGKPESNALYYRLTRNKPSVAWSQTAQQAQERFLRGLEEFAKEGLLHHFDEERADYISGHGSDAILLVQGPPGTGKSYTTAFAVLARMQGAMAEERRYCVQLSCKTHAATDVLIKSLRKVQQILMKLHEERPELFSKYFDRRLLAVPLIRVGGREQLGGGFIEYPKDSSFNKVLKEIGKYRWVAVAMTPGSAYKLAWNDREGNCRWADCLVIDEASQINLPEACMAALGLGEEGQLIVVGDHRQMPPIVRHDWEGEPRRTFQEYESFRSLFGLLMSRDVPIVRFSESFRLHKVMARFLCNEVYIRDGINFYSRREELLDDVSYDEPFVRAVLKSDYPLIVVIHDEAVSQTQNLYELSLTRPVLEALSKLYGLDASDGLGVVVPHRLQRGLIRRFVSCLTTDGTSAVDTVERFQGDERDVVVVSATESDPQFIQLCSKFLLDPRRLTVALSRARKKMVLVASRSIFEMFEPDRETFENLCMWKNLKRFCKDILWEGKVGDHNVCVRGACI